MCTHVYRWRRGVELLEGKTASAVTIVTPLVLNPISVRPVLSPKLPVVLPHLHPRDCAIPPNFCSPTPEAPTYNARARITYIYIDAHTHTRTPTHPHTYTRTHAHAYSFSIPETPFCLLPRAVSSPFGGDIRTGPLFRRDVYKYIFIYCYYFLFFASASSFFYVLVFFSSRNDYLLSPRQPSPAPRLFLFFSYFFPLFFSPRACTRVFRSQFIFCYFLDFCGLSRIFEQSILWIKGRGKRR